MSAQIFKKLRKPGYAPTLIAGMLSNIMVFAEPVSRATTNLMNETLINRVYTVKGNPGTHGFSSLSGPGEFPDLPVFNKETKTKPVEKSTPEVKPDPSNDEPGANKYTPLEEYSVYYAEEGQGAIGKATAYQADNVRDNYFTITLPEDINLTAYTPVLTYDLYGVATADGTTKSINGSGAYGGTVIEKDEQWKEVEEYLPGLHLRPGQNTLFFNRRVDELYGYNVKNIRIKLHKNTGETNEKEITQSLKTIEVDSRLDSKTFFPEEKGEDMGVFQFYAVKLDVIADEENAVVLPSLTIFGLPFKDIKPLEQELVNVTRGAYEGYKVGTNEGTDLGANPIKLHLSYDPEKIPLGYTAKDIRTFYFDNSDKSWKALPLEALDREGNAVVSLINDPGGETDYINGVIKVPEQPETSNFVPTTLTDIEFANPAAGVVSIAPPSPNSTGSLSTSFPIKLPAGRNGMQPSLEVSYNSDGGNGWMGMGWDIGIPAITLNTKWGAPLFDADYESELYSLSGQDLVLNNYGDYTNPHREDSLLRNQSSSRQFFLRKEGSYLEIIRHEETGVQDKTEKYWWEVTDKLGNKSYYGGIASVDNNAVLRDEGSSGNIAHWALVRQEDTQGNYVEYEYDKQSVTVNGISGWEFYIKSITYTRHSTAMSNYYKVGFTRDTVRNDITTSARNGFFQITKDVLSEISISFVQGSSSDTIRTYEFEYEEGSFLKQRLKKISEFDTKGNLFYSNTLEYYDMENSDIIDHINTQNWESDEDPFSSTLYDFTPGEFKQLVPEGSALGASESNGFSIGFRAGVGIGTNASKVTTTLGGSFSYKESTLNTKVSFLDINGDGLPDKVFAHNGTVYYRPNLGNGFGQLIPISSLSRLGKTESWTRGTAFDANVGIAGFGLGIGYGDSRTRSATDHYFIDFNGDGLPDMISNNRVKFNKTQANSDPLARYFDMDGIAETENPIVSGNIDPSIIPNLELETLEEIRERHPQFDHVRVWRAPYDGDITISSQAQLIQQPDCGAPSDPNINGDNHFRLTLEHAEYDSGNDEYAQTSLVGSAVTLTDTTSSPTMNPSISGVNKGDLLFFRIHNLENGCGGTVKWEPEIEYSAFDTGVGINTSDSDEHGVLFSQYDSEEDFMINNGGDWVPDPDIDNVSISFNLLEADFQPYQFSDDIEFVIERVSTNTTNDEENVVNTWTRVFNHKGIGVGQDVFSGNSTMNGVSMAPDPNADLIFSLRFYARSTSNIVWEEIVWKPTIDTGGDIHYPPVSNQTYDDNLYQTSYWIEANDLPPIGTITPGEENDSLVKVHHNLYSQSHNMPPSVLIDFLEALDEEGVLPIRVNWTIKEEYSDTVRTVHKKSFYLIEDGGSLEFSQNPNTHIPPANDDEIYFFSKEQIKNIRDNNGKIYTTLNVDNSLVGNFNLTNITIENALQQQVPSMSPVVLDRPFMANSPVFYGLTHRGWGQFLYNGGILLNRDSEGELTGGGEDFSASPIVMDIVNIDPEEVNSDLDNVDPTDPSTVDGDFSTVNRFVFYTQDNENGSYINSVITGAAYGDSSSGITATLGRFARQNLFDVYVSFDDLVDGDPGQFIGIKQRSKSNGSSITAQGNSPFGGVGGTDSEGRSKTLNQYIDLNGDRYPDLVTGGLVQYTGMTGGLGDKTANPNFSSGDRSDDFTGGVTILPPSSTGSDNGKSSGNKTTTNAQSGVNVGEGHSDSSRLWVDMNGDGLTDQVKISGTDIKVRLNTGYGFTTNEVIWGNGYSDMETNTRSSKGIGASGGLGQAGELTDASFAIGFGLAESTANSEITLLDVNSDGLPDLVFKSGSIYKYYLNTGTGFDGTTRTFYKKANIEEDVSATGNLFGTFTFGFSIPVISIKITFTPTFGVDKGVSEKKIMIQDINGDGLPDVLHKKPGSGNGSVEAHLNQVDKTHLLKKVNTPLGGSWEVEYAQVGNTYEMPQSKWVISALKTHDGFTDDDDFDEAENETLTKFIYENGYHDRRERDFYGFEKVRTEQCNPTDESRYRYTEKKYHNKNYYLKGALKETASYTNADEMLSISRQYYNLRKPDLAFQSEINVGHDDPYIEPLIGDLDRTRAFPVLVKTIATTFENAQSLNMVQEFNNYDAFGNITQYLNPGTGQEDAYRTEITYNNTNFSGLPTHIKVFKNSGNVLMREREADYNNQGKLQLITTHLGGSNTNQIIMEHDNFGNTIQIDQPDNTGAGGSGHFTQFIEYDNVIHTYPVSFSDSYGQSSTAIYDHQFGIPVLVTDMNDNSMRTRIDNRGRVIEIAGPNEYHPNMSDGTDWIIRKQYKGEDTVEYQVGGSGPNDYRFESAQGSFPAVNPGTTQPVNSQHHAVTRHNDPLSTNDNEFLTVSIVDGFGQAIQMKKKHVVGGTNPVWQVGGFQGKDAYGRVVNTYLPGIQGGILDSYTTLTSGDWTYDNIPPASLPDPVVMDYDERDRQIEITQPGESVSTNITYAIESFTGMFVTKVVNELQQTQDTYTDIRGRQRKTIQNSEITTEFFYNAINELTRVRNNEGYETTYDYDQAGRRTWEFHPDRGLTTFSYDNAGRLTEKQTSNLMQQGSTGLIAYHYDFHRLLEIEYPHHPDNNVSYVYGDDPNVNSVGRLIEQEDATGIQLFAYDRMGQLIHQLRSIVVAGKKSYWFKTEWDYDSWNRVKKITYPNYEEVSYHYDPAGQLQSITTNIISKFPQPSSINMNGIVTNIKYTEYGERAEIEYGNGTITNYDYDTRRRMDYVEHQFPGFQIDKHYFYDELSNITGISTGPSVTAPSTGVLGGPIDHTYKYDDYNRLIQANGYYVGPDDDAPLMLKQAYTLDMEYDASHKILGKQQTHQFGNVSNYGDVLPQNAPHAVATSYTLAYEDYAGGEHDIGGQYYVQPHAPRTITEYPNENFTGDPNDPRIKKKKIDYDANGNMTKIKEQISDPNQPLGHKEVALRHNLWDEDDRLRAVDLDPEATADKPQIAAYTYDAGGERTIKYIPGRFDAYYSAKDPGSIDRMEAILYPNPLVTVKTLPLPGDIGELERVTLTKYTNHYYIGSERISSALGTTKSLGLLCEQTGFPDPAVVERMDAKVGEAGTALTGIYTAFEKNLTLSEPLLYGTNNTFICDGSYFEEMYEHYWYHPDHLGSSSYITNLAGDITQHMEYLPFGETLVEEHLNSNNSPYKFNAKELDAETGWYYYGARYYDPKWSIWLSVDPLAEKMPSWSPYSYAFNNPIVYVDPDGQYPIIITTRSYAPFKSFGPPFARYHGDDRSHSLKPDASYRTSVGINYDTETHKRSFERGRSLSYEVGSNPEDGTYSDTGINDRSKGSNLDVHSYGNNADVSNSFDIDQFTKLSVTTDGDIKGDHILNVSGTISGDDFPNQESFITDSDGNSLWLGNFETTGSQTWGPVTDLPRENEGDININININIMVNGDGVFQGVKQGDQTISIQDWNKQFE